MWRKPTKAKNMPFSPPQLKAMFGTESVEKAEFLEAKVTSWGRDPYALGSYSYMPKRARPEDYDALLASG